MKWAAAGWGRGCKPCSRAAMQSRAAVQPCSRAAEQPCSRAASCSRTAARCVKTCAGVCRRATVSPCSTHLTFFCTRREVGRLCAQPSFLPPRAARRGAKFSGCGRSRRNANSCGYAPSGAALEILESKSTTARRFQGCRSRCCFAMQENLSDCRIFSDKSFFLK